MSLGEFTAIEFMLTFGLGVRWYLMSKMSGRAYILGERIEGGPSTMGS